MKILGLGPDGQKVALYFGIAVLGAGLAATKQPEGAWEWARLIGGMLLSGFNAMKALQSAPGGNGEPALIRHGR